MVFFAADTILHFKEEKEGRDIEDSRDSIKAGER